MANPLFIKIELPPETEESAVAGTGNGSTGGLVSDFGNETSKEQGGWDNEKFMKGVKRMVSFSAVKSTADTLISNRISAISLRTGATEYEQRLAYIHGAVSQTVGAGAALIGAGLAGGPAGLALAAIGVAVSGAQKLLAIAQKNEQLQLQEDIENISIGMARTRAGVSGRREKNQ